MAVMHGKNATWDLNLLRVLDAVLRERHITRAGDRLGLSQAATSHALARLRKQFSDQLLVRAGREMVLTPEAERLLPIVERILRSVTDELETDEFDPRTSTAALTLIMPDFLGLRILPTLIPMLQAEAPGIVLSAHSLDATAEGRLRSGEVDGLIMPTTRIPESLPRISLGSVPWRGLASATNTQVSDDMTVEDFCRLPHVTIPRAAVHIEIDRQLAARGMVRRAPLSIADCRLIDRILHGTNLVSVIAAGDQISRGLRHFRLPIEPPPISYGLVWSERLTNNPASAWMREGLAEVARANLDQE